VPDSVRDFAAAFNADAAKHESLWRAEPAERVVRLPGNRYLIPDFEFAHAGTGRRVLMEHILYPTPERIVRVLELAGLAAAAAQDGPPVSAYWITCRRSAGLPDDPRLATYRRTLLASQVRERLETAPSNEPAGP
jgi:hypothetical protein